MVLKSNIMNEKQGGLIGAFIGWLSGVTRKFGDIVDWAYLINSGMNALVGAIVAFVATYYLRQFFNVKPKQSEVDKLVEQRLKELTEDKDNDIE
jgi:hypothetical protein